MIGRRRRAGDSGCGHHWHASDAGWECCACPGLVAARQTPPAPGTAACRAQADHQDSILAWLGASAERPARPGRRAGRRTALRPGP